MEDVTHLVTVSDGSVKGLHAAATIQDLAGRVIAYQQAALVVNRLQSRTEADSLVIPETLSLAGWLPEDDAVRRADISGSNLLDLPDSAFFVGVQTCLRKLGIG